MGVTQKQYLVPLLFYFDYVYTDSGRFNIMHFIHIHFVEHLL